MQLLKHETIIGIDVFLERHKSNIFVGTLSFEKKSNNFVFRYSEQYLYAKNIIPMGPEFPVTQVEFISGKLFASFKDRIPSKRNSAYKDYCLQMGISPNEKDVFVLLATIGRRGPSSFIFEPHYEDNFDAKKLSNFRKQLGLTTREFASVFEVTQAAIVNIENENSSGKEILKRLKIYYKFPTLCLYQLYMNGGMLQSDKRMQAMTSIVKIIKKTENLRESSMLELIKK